MIKFIYIIFFIVVVSGCNKKIEPIGDLRVEEKVWSRMLIKYWVRDSELGQIEKYVEISDAAIIGDGFSKLKVKKITGYDLAGGDQIKLVSSKGELWDAKFIFEDRVDFSLSKNKSYSYNYFLENNDFYNWVRNICLDRLKSEYPNASEDSVILRENTDLGRYPVLDSRRKRNSSE